MIPRNEASMTARRPSRPPAWLTVLLGIALGVSGSACGTTAADPIVAGDGGVVVGDGARDAPPPRGDAVSDVARGGCGPSTTFTVPCALTAADEACWASHTGVRGYTKAQILAGQSDLTHHVGDITVTADGTVIDRMWIDGCVAIKANNVTIRNSLIRAQHGCAGGDGQAAPSGINTGTGSGPGTVTGLLIEDTEVDGMDPDSNYAGVSAANYTCRRCNVHSFVTNFWAGRQVVIEDSYSGALSLNPNIQNGTNLNVDSGSHVSVRHTYLRARGINSTNGAIFAGASWQPPFDITVDHCYLEGFAGADIAQACAAHDITITNNAFSSNNGWGGSQFIYGYNPTNANMIWCGNYIPETGAPLPQPGGC